nr:MAG TPA: hypothetical protein [Caudoviricetes sp.]
MLSVFKFMQKEFHYTIKEILSMSKLDFLVFLDSLTTGENTDSVKTMAIDEAFPEFFLDPNAKNQKKGG